MPAPETRELPLVDIGVACNKWQHHKCWTSLWKLKGADIGELRTAQSAMVDKNRNEIVAQFLEGKAEYLFFVDDDVQLIEHVLLKLLLHELPICAGVYYRGGLPHDPLMFKRLPSGWYETIRNWDRGAIVEVDSVGMGCCLIHRSVFERIMKVYQPVRSVGNTFSRGGLKLIARPNIGYPEGVDFSEYDGMLVHNHLVLRYEPTDMTENERYPFYRFQEGQTEDHYFCSLAQSVGYKIVVDTDIELGHWQLRPVTRADFEGVQAQLRRRGYLD